MNSEAAVAAKAIAAAKQLNDSQQDAVVAAATQRLTLVQGPPGTGKTKVAIAILRAWVASSLTSRGTAQGACCVFRIGRIRASLRTPTVIAYMAMVWPHGPARICAPARFLPHVPHAPTHTRVPRPHRAYAGQRVARRFGRHRDAVTSPFPRRYPAWPVLAVSDSNIAVDNLLEGLAA